MASQDFLAPTVDIVLPAGPARASQAELTAPATELLPPAFDPDSTLHFQAKMSKAPEWFCSIVASNKREKRRFSSELVHMRGAWPLLMKQRNGGKWTPEGKKQTQADGAVSVKCQPVFVYLGDSGLHVVAAVFSLVFRQAAQKQSQA